MSPVSNVPSGQCRKQIVKTQPFLSHVSDYHGMFYHPGGLQDLKNITNTPSV